MLKIYKYILFFLVLFTLGSCSKYQTLVKKGTPDQKYKAALKYYAKDDYFHAQQLFDELIVIYRGTNKLERIYYLYAQTYYKQGDYIVASYHFKYFAKTFPKSQYAEESLYLSAYCKYLDSPPDNLDQTSTKEAISDMQMFINLYPNSDKIDEANKVMDELRAKLVTKDFDSAKQYYKTQYFKAAVYALSQHIKDYPASPYREEAMFLIIEANFDFASKSIYRKQKERYTNVITAYNDYIASYPEGKYTKQAHKYMKSANNRIAQIDAQRTKKINRKLKV